MAGAAGLRGGFSPLPASPLAAAGLLPILSPPRMLPSSWNQTLSKHAAPSIAPVSGTTQLGCRAGQPGGRDLSDGKGTFPNNPVSHLHPQR